MQVTNVQLSNCAQLNVNELKKIRASALNKSYTILDVVVSSLVSVVALD